MRESATQAFRNQGLDSMRDVLDQLVASTSEVIDALSACDLRAPSRLPGWSRLTIACHLRYGASALHRMTLETLSGWPTAFYPMGRDVQRPGTLEPLPGEPPTAVVFSLADTSARLDDTWSRVTDWHVPVREPEGIFTTMRSLAIARLTEVEVHGTDLAVGLGPWSDVLVEHALPVRLQRLQARRQQAPGAWVVRGIAVGDGSEPEIIDAPDRELLAMLLGRRTISESFRRAYPGP